MPKIPTSTINLKLGKGLSFSSKDSNGNKISVGTPEIDGEEFNGFSPGDMMLTSLAACSGIDVVTILKKQRQYVTNLEIKVTGTQEKDAPWTWIKAHIEYTIKGQNLNKNWIKRAIDLSENKYCSIGSTIAPKCTITSDFVLIEEQ